jgi:hypothetical protein
VYEVDNREGSRRPFKKYSGVIIAGFSLMFFCSRILWKSKKDELKDKEANVDVTSHLAYAIAATIVTVKYKTMKVCVI